MLFYFSLIILSLNLGAQIIQERRLYNLRSFGVKLLNYEFLRIYEKKFFKHVFIFSVILLFSILFYDSWMQYSIWSQNEFSKSFLPPYQTINYFLFYVGMRFFAPYLISLAFAFLFFFAAKYFNKKYQEKFFYEEEFYIGALAIFLIGYPLAVFYLIAVALIYLLAHFILAGASKNLGGRLSTYYLWLPIAIFVIIISKWLVDLEWWRMLKL